VVVSALAADFLLGYRTYSDYQMFLVCAGIDLALRAILVVRGNRLAWRPEDYPFGIGEFVARQRRWQRAAIVVFLLVALTVGYVAYTVPRYQADEISSWQQDEMTVGGGD
jgi:membrane protease YdiL (CAAX protease family)